MTFIFAFGSLMWRPGFEYKGVIKNAKLRGFHRDFTVKSIHRWGTKENPGATLGLEQGGECIGVVYEIRDENTQEVMAYLREREGLGFSFPEIQVEITENNQTKTVRAFTSMNKHDHGYLGHLDIKTRAQLVSKAKGEAGTNCDYVTSTRNHLVEMGIEDPYVEQFYKEMKDK